ncbi:MAG: RNA polymerase sigma-70 factor [Flammeovirgaceae bacterium]|nr:RNA polymerase sigma-70 factor [Flammeovirgaceae bacterium]
MSAKMERTVQDNAWFQRIKKDDRKAFDTLFAHYYQGLCSFANTLLKNSEDSEEVVLDTFLNFWKARKTLTIQNIQAYLYTSVKYASLACLRKKRTRLQVTDQMPECPDESYHENQFAYAELAEQVDTAVMKLPMRCKQIFIMNRFYGMRYKEISEALGVTEKTVENQLAKGLQLVRAAIRKYQDVPSEYSL